MNERVAATSSTPPSEHLPPRDMLLHDWVKDGKVPTPVDENGLVDVTALIKVVKQSVDPTYDWKSNMNDIHHIQWPQSMYSHQSLLAIDNGATAQNFRNQRNNLIHASRTFHSHLHNHTLPPKPPTEEVMYHSNQAQQIRLALVRSVKLASELHAKPWIRQERMDRGESYHVDSFYTIREQLQQVPDEFRLVDLSDFEPQSIEDIHEISARIKLGKRVTMATVQQLPSRKSQNLATGQSIAS